MQHMVQQLKEHWLRWVIGGIPTAIVLLGMFCAAAVQAGKIEASLADLQSRQPAHEARLTSLEDRMHELEIELQAVKDELRFERKINEQPPHRKGAIYPQLESRGWENQ